MKLQTGKKYINREGKTIEITSALDERTTPYQMGYRFVGGLCGQYYTEDGLTYINDPADNPRDLVKSLDIHLKDLEIDAVDVLLKALDFDMDLDALCEKAQDAWQERFRG